MTKTLQPSTGQRTVLAMSYASAAVRINIKSGVFSLAQEVILKSVNN
jgi:hypothetical protein